RDSVAQIHNQLDKVKVFVEVSDTPDVANFAVQYERLANTGSGEDLDIQRSPDDQIMVYTGGTTGMPKGVIYAQGDLAAVLLARVALLPGIVPQNTDDVVKLTQMVPASRYLPACPQMHGTGFFGTMATVMTGGAVVTVDSASLDPDAIWSAVEKNRVTAM